MEEWYRVQNIYQIDTPALLIYKSRVVENIRLIKSMTGDICRLRPHVKTHKTKEAAVMQMEAGITKFKCATIAEGEMLAMIGASDVLLAYQPIGPKLKRFVALIQKYPATTFSCLIDNLPVANLIARAAMESGAIIPVYLDLNVGMNRTGITPGVPAIELYEACLLLKGISVKGLHAYDGHIHSLNMAQRTTECNQAFEPVEQMQKHLVQRGHAEPSVIAGGSPTFPIHTWRPKVECSPGTFIFWDKGYEANCPEQPFLPAALIVSRVVSLPGENMLCLDLGHKSIASENGLEKRVFFLNAPDLKFTSHSEEHLVATAPAGHKYKTGDVLYGLPYHICPTVALYERALVVADGEVNDEWMIVARDKKISL